MNIWLGFVMGYLFLDNDCVASEDFKFLACVSQLTAFLFH